MSSKQPRVITASDAPLTGFSSGTPSPLSMGIAYGDTLYVSGQGPLDPSTKEIVSADIEIQTSTVLQNMLNVVTAAGATKNHILRCNVYLSDMDNFGAFNSIYRSFFEPADHFPARTCVKANAPREGVLVEIDCIAAIPDE